MYCGVSSGPVLPIHVGGASNAKIHHASIHQQQSLSDDSKLKPKSHPVEIDSGTFNMVDLEKAYTAPSHESSLCLDTTRIIDNIVHSTNESQKSEIYEPLNISSVPKYQKLLYPWKAIVKGMKNPDKDKNREAKSVRENKRLDVNSSHIIPVEREVVMNMNDGMLDYFFKSDPDAPISKNKKRLKVNSSHIIPVEREVVMNMNDGMLDYFFGPDPGAPISESGVLIQSASKHSSCSISIPVGVAENEIDSGNNSKTQVAVRRTGSKPSSMTIRNSSDEEDDFCDSSDFSDVTTDVSDVSYISTEEIIKLTDESEKLGGQRVYHPRNSRTGIVSSHKLNGSSNNVQVQCQKPKSFRRSVTITKTETPDNTSSPTVDLTNRTPQELSTMYLLAALQNLGTDLNTPAGISASQNSPHNNTEQNANIFELKQRRDDASRQLISILSNISLTKNPTTNEQIDNDPSNGILSFNTSDLLDTVRRLQNMNTDELQTKEAKAAEKRREDLGYDASSSEDDEYDSTLSVSSDDTIVDDEETISVL